MTAKTPTLRSLAVQRRARHVQLVQSSFEWILIILNIISFSASLPLLAQGMDAAFKLDPFQNRILNVQKAQEVHLDEKPWLMALYILIHFLIVNCVLVILFICLFFLKTALRPGEKSFLKFNTITMFLLITLQMVLLIAVLATGRTLADRHVARIAERTKVTADWDAQQYCTMLAEIQTNFTCCGVDGTSVALLPSSKETEICGTDAGELRQRLNTTCADAENQSDEKEEKIKKKISCGRSVWSNIWLGYDPKHYAVTIVFLLFADAALMLYYGIASFVIIFE